MENLPQPVQGYVLAKDKGDQTIGNLTIASDEKDRESVIGECVLCGPDIIEDQQIDVDGFLKGHLVKNCPVKIGQTFYYKKYSADSITFKGIQYKLIEFKNIVAVQNG